MHKTLYPYLPDDREIKYVGEDNEFMSEAKKIWQNKGCAKQKTAAVVVKKGEIIGRGSNAGKTVNVCPRVLKGSKTGEDYHYCKDICKQEGHSEVTSVKNARDNGEDANGADLYLYGHWWCCKNCWDTMIEAGIKNVFLVEGAEDKFNFSPHIGKIYISGALTYTDERKKKIYENIAQICSTACNNVYVPHLGGTDPKHNPDITSEAVWKKNHHEVATADLIIAYVGEPSLGTGGELEIARITNSELILWWFKGEKVSRMALGNPAVKYFIEAEDENDLEIKLKTILKDYAK